VNLNIAGQVLSGDFTFQKSVIGGVAQIDITAENVHLGLGDGTGMNFCLKVRGVAKHIVDALSESYA